jgi:hypothetical protein
VPPSPPAKLARVRHVAALAAAAGSAAAAPGLLPLRPPAAPLIVQSPYLSVWSPWDAATDGATAHWSGAASTLVGLLRVDGTPYQWLGAAGQAPAGTARAAQVGLPSVSATSTAYTFAAGGVALNVTFTSPLVATNVTLLSTPATYVSFSAAAADGAGHAVAVYFDFDATLVTNNSFANDTLVTWARVDGAVGGGVSGVRVGAASQWPLNPIVCGQSEPLTASQTIVWGWAYLLADADAAPAGSNATSAGPTVAARAQFAADGTLPAAGAPPPAEVGAGFPGASAVVDLGTVPASGAPVGGRVTFFMDEILAASFYVNVSVWDGNPAVAVLPPLWRKDLPFNDTVGVPGAALRAAHDGAPAALAAAAATDTDVFTRVATVADAAAATFASLVYRQVLAAGVVAWHPGRAEPWVVFKEIASGGDFQTADVVYPASPLLVTLAPEVLGWSLLPLLVASANETVYKKAWAIHDIGKFPIAWRLDGQQEDMPVEETANLLILLAAISMQRGGDVSWAAEFTGAPGGGPRWAGFLVDSLPFLARQGTTDDFLGATANNTNLAWKAAAGLAAWGYLQFQAGNTTGAASTWEFAGYSAAVLAEYGWYADPGPAAANRSHFVWGFGYDGAYNSTFLQYNGLWPRVLRMHNLLPNQTGFVAAQAAFTATNNLFPFGVPLINGSTGTKGDWMAYYASSLYPPAPPGGRTPPPHPLSTALWAASLAAANTTAARTGMTDFWDVRTAAYGGKYRARPVLGAAFAPAAVAAFDALPAMPHEAPMAAAFDAGHARAAAEAAARRAGTA